MFGAVLIVFRSASSYFDHTCSGTMYTHGGMLGAKVGFFAVQTSVVSFGVVKTGWNGK